MGKVGNFGNGWWRSGKTRENGEIDVREKGGILRFEIFSGY